jgi:hypothetical protein
MAYEPHFTIRAHLISLVGIPELPGYMADGETCEQVVANAQEVIEE